MVGRHIIKTRSATQAIVALSSGGDVLYGVVGASGVALGHKSLLEDIGLRLPTRVWTDFSDAMGICGRQGLGKLRHIDYDILFGSNNDYDTNTWNYARSVDRSTQLTSSLSLLRRDSRLISCLPRLPASFATDTRMQRRFSAERV